MTDTRHQHFLNAANKGQRPLSAGPSNAILASDVIVGKPMAHLELQSSGGNGLGNAGQNQEIRIIGSNCFFISDNLGIELIGNSGQTGRFLGVTRLPPGISLGTTKSKTRA